MRMNVSQTGSKRIYPGLKGVMTKIDENTFKYSRAITKVAVGRTRKLATWINLNLQAILQVDGVDMATGAIVGFFGSTNKENAEGAEHHNFLVGEEIERPTFELKKKKAREEDEMAPTPPVCEDGHPSDAAKTMIGDIWLSRLKDTSTFS